MPSSDQTLEVLIQLGVVGQQDVKAANDLLKDATATATASGEATKDLGQKTETAATSLKLFNTHSAAFSQSLEGLNQITPGLGALLQAALNPENIGSAGIILAVQLLAGYFKTVRDEADKTNESIKQMKEVLSNINQIENPIPRVDAEAVATAAVNTQKLAEAEHGASSFADDLKKRLTDELAVINATAEADTNELKAREQKEIAESRLAGMTSSRTAELQRIEEEKIHNRFQNDNEASAEFAEQRRMQPLMNEQRQREEHQASLKEWAQQAIINVANLGTERSTADMISNLKAEQKAAYDLTIERNSEKTGSDKWNDLDKQVQIRKNTVKNLSDEIINGALHETKVNDDLTAALAAVSENTKRLDELATQLPIATKVANIHSQSADVIQNYQSATLVADTQTALLTEHNELKGKVSDFNKKKKSSITQQDIDSMTEIFKELNRILPLIIAGDKDPNDIAQLRQELADVKANLAKRSDNKGS